MDFVFIILTVLLLVRNCCSSSPSAESVILLDTMQDEWRGWKTNSGKYSGWRSQNIPPDGDKVYGLCMVHRADNDNWLYSPIIPTGEAHSIIIETYFSMRNCRNYPDPSKLKTCEDTIHLLTYDTDDIRESTNQNNGLFKQTSVLFPQNKWTKGQSSQPTMNIHKVSIQVKSLGIRIGYRDTGSCTMMRRIRVHYLVCPAIINSFTSFPRTVSKHFYDIVNVIGTCVKGAVQKAENSDQLQNRFCQSNGLWHDMGTVNCYCGVGYTASNDWKTCIPCASGTYKPIPGPSRCSYCPKYSYSESGQSTCECEKGHFKKFELQRNSLQLSCLQLPGPPSDLKADITDGSKVILTWRAPRKPDLADSDNIEYYYISCNQCSTKEVQFLPARNVTETSVTIFGLNFGENYAFTVTSMASISNYSTNMMINPSQASVKFTLPKTNSFIIKSVIITRQSNSTFLISWTVPDTISDVDMFSVQIANIYPSNQSDYETKYEYIFTSNTKCFYTTELIPTETYARVRFKHNGEWSDLSPSPIINNIFQENNYKDDLSQVNKSIFPWMPNLDVIFLCVTSLVIVVIVLSVSVILMRKYIYQNMKRSNGSKHQESSLVENTKSSYASITASSPSRPRSYFYLSSIDNLTTSTPRVLNEIQSQSIIMKTLNRPGKFFDVYDGAIKQPRKLVMDITLNVLKPDEKDEVVLKILDDCREISQFQHENIINILGFSTCDSPMMIILEYMANGCLNFFLKENIDKLNMYQLLNILHDIGEGMYYLSERKFIHKKLCTYNIFVNESMICKLSICLLNWKDDVDQKTGLTFIDSQKTCNAISWLAPEVQLDNSYSTASDIWAFGVTMWEVFSYGEKPYWDWTAETISKVILEGYRLPPPKNCYHNLHLLMLSCWILDASLRPNFLIILRNLDQLINYVEKQLININQSIEGLKSNNVMPMSMSMSKNNRNSSLDNISIDDFQSLKQKQDSMPKKRSCSSIINTQSLDQGTILSNIYVSTNGLKSSSTYSPHFKDIYSTKHQDKTNSMQLTKQDSTVNLNNWLSEINLRKYKRLLVKNGFSSRSKLAHISIADLTDMGIKKASEIQILINNAHQLRNNYQI